MKSGGTCLLTQCPEDRGRKIRSSRPARAKTKQNKNSGSTIWPQWVSLKKKKKKDMKLSGGEEVRDGPRRGRGVSSKYIVYMKLCMKE